MPVAGTRSERIVAKFKYKVVREFVHVQQYFDGFALEWRELPARFFRELYDALGQRLNIQPVELSANAGTQLSEVRARYSIYGGPSAVTLMADRIAFDFPNITVSDLALVYEIMGSIHDRFPNAFPELKLGRVEVQGMSHLDVGSQENVNAFFERFKIPTLSDAFNDLPAQIICGPKFHITSEDGKWKCNVVAEPSQVSSTAIFAVINSTLIKSEPTAKYLDKAGVINNLAQRCLNALNLEIDDAAPQ
jgi:hypothetical protein